MYRARGMASHDPDDWFDEPDVSEAPDRRIVPPAEEDWLAPAEDRPARGTLLTRRAALLGLVAAVLLVALLGGLAAAGVFGGAAPKPKAVFTPPATTALPPAATTTTAPAQPALPTGPLKPGDTGAQVKLLQSALKTLGDYTGAIDGDYGPGTQAAVQQFQRFAGLTADGVAGPQTLSALRHAIASP